MLQKKKEDYLNREAHAAGKNKGPIAPLGISKIQKKKMEITFTLANFQFSIKKFQITILPDPFWFIDLMQ